MSYFLISHRTNCILIHVLSQCLEHLLCQMKPAFETAPTLSAIFIKWWIVSSAKESRSCRLSRSKGRPLPLSHSSLARNCTTTWLPSSTSLLHDVLKRSLVVAIKGICRAYPLTQMNTMTSCSIVSWPNGWKTVRVPVLMKFVKWVWKLHCLCTVDAGWRCAYIKKYAPNKRMCA